MSHPEFRDTRGRIDALRMPSESDPVRRSRGKRVVALVALALLVAAGLYAFVPRTEATSLDAVLPLPEGMTTVEEERWCRPVGFRDQTCSGTAYVAAPTPEDAARDRVVAALTSRGWRDTGGGLMFRDGDYVRVRTVSAASPPVEDLRKAYARALAHDPPAKVEIVVYAWSPV